MGTYFWTALAFLCTGGEFLLEPKSRLALFESLTLFSGFIIPTVLGCSCNSALACAAIVFRTSVAVAAHSGVTCLARLFDGRLKMPPCQPFGRVCIVKLADCGVK